MANNIGSGKKILASHLEDGSAFEKFRQIVKAQGGDIDFIDNPEKFVSPKFIIEMKSEYSGYISELDSLKVAYACKIMGAGQSKKDDEIDHAVGIVLNKKIGDKIFAGEVLANVHANSEYLAQKAVDLIKEAYKFSAQIPEIPKLIYEVIG